MAFDLDPDYKQVPERIKELKEKHPNARLRPTDPTRPYWLESISGYDEDGDVVIRTFLVYSAACFRDAEDELPGIGIAWEPFPGTTPYTRNSELQNAETSAWGRAIIATLASESKAVASAEDVRNRTAEAAEPHSSGGNPPRGPRVPKAITANQLKFVTDLFSRTGLDAFALKDIIGREVVTPTEFTTDEAKKAIDHLIKVRDGEIEKPAAPERRTTAEPPPVEPPEEDQEPF